MPLEVFAMVLVAALVHATWNALMKADGDRLALLQAMATTQLVLSLALLPFVPVPAVESWPCLAANPLLTTAYTLLLERAYRSGDLSLVYPLARGIAPLAVATISLLLLGEHLSQVSQAAVLLIGLGITSLALTRGAAGLRDWRPILLALTTGAFIASYTAVDGVGARLAGSAGGYMVWITLLSSPLIVVCTHLLRRSRRTPTGRTSYWNGIAAAILSYGASWVVIWAFTVAPIALVSALRETGIVFAVVIGVVFLNERLSLARLGSIAATLVGTALLKLSR
jgi:drug/metabolite transporter (DMT)-like permease